MTEVNNDPIVVEDPVVDVNDGNDQGISGGVKSNTKYITVVASVLISVIIYFFAFSGKKETDVIDPNALVRETKAGNVNSRATIDDIDSVVSNGIDYNDRNYVDSGNSGILELPQLPELPENITQDIEEEIKETKRGNVDENTFTKEEVDELINIKLKSFEKEMSKMRSESEKLARELEERKIAEEEEKKKKKFSSVLSGTPVVPPAGEIPAVGNDGLPPELSGDVVAAMEEQKKQEERDLQIAQRSRVMEERKSSPMFKMQGGGGGDGTESEQNSIIITDKDSLATVKEAKINVPTTKTSDLSRIISQGKIIGAVLETSIDTDVQTQVSAIVSRDVYSQLGKNILIPKGSKLIGSFQAVQNNGSARLGIVWNRIIRSDGLSISINANSADNLGRGGVEGDLDNKYTQVMRNAFLSSVVSIASAALVDKVTDTVSTTTTSTGTSGTATTTTSNATNQAIIDATKNFSDEMQDIVDNLKEQSPTIRIAQGTRISVIVNQDLTLPIYKQLK